MVATSGARLICEDAVEELKVKLLPAADVLTPNIPEAEVLSAERLLQRKKWRRRPRRLANLTDVQFC